jgi:hypothetical protein
MQYMLYTTAVTLLTRLMPTPSSHPAIVSPPRFFWSFTAVPNCSYLHLLKMGRSMGAAGCSSCCLGAAADRELPVAGKKN